MIESECEILAQLASPDEATRIDAAEEIGEKGHVEHVRVLIERLAEEKSRAVQESIFSALDAIGIDAVAEYVPGLLTSEDPYLRNQTVRMVQSGGTKSTPIVRELLASDDRDIRKFAVDVLSGLRFEQVADLYATALRDSDINVLITAMESIRPRHDARLAGLVVEKVLGADHPMLLLAGLEALTRLQDPSAYNRLRTRFAPLEKADPLIIPHLVKLAGQHGGEHEMQELAALLPKASPSLSLSIFDAIHQLFGRGIPIPPALDRHLLSSLSHDGSRISRYRLLGIAGDFRESQPIFESLRAFLESPEKLERLGAIEGLLANMSERAATFFSARLEIETDPEVREALAAAIKSVGGACSAAHK